MWNYIYKTMPTIRKIELSECETLYRQMMEDFPPSELAPYPSIRKNLENGVFDALYMTDDNGVKLAYMILTALEGTEYVFGNYLAVSPLYHNKGIGSEFLKQIIEKYRGKIIVIEVEDPQAATTEEDRIVRERRIRIYSKLGFRIMPTKRAEIFGVKMQIMANTDKELSNMREVVRAAYSFLVDDHLMKFIDVVD